MDLKLATAEVVEGETAEREECERATRSIIISKRETRDETGTRVRARVVQRREAQWNNRGGRKA